MGSDRAIVGALVGLFFLPLGLILGPLIGAYAFQALFAKQGLRRAAVSGFSSEKVASLGAAASPSSALRCRQDFAHSRYRLTPQGGNPHSLILGRRQIRRHFSGWRTLEPVAFVTRNSIQEPANDRSQSHCAERSIYWQHLEIPRVVR